MPLIRVSKLTFRALALPQLETSALKLNGGQFMLSTQLIIPDYLVRGKQSSFISKYGLTLTAARMIQGIIVYSLAEAQFVQAFIVI